MSVTFDQLSGDLAPMTEVGLAVLAAGYTVQFAGSERMTCDGAAFALTDRVAVFQVLRAPTAQAVGTTIRCNYTVGGETAGVALQIPQAPAITSPEMDALVVRSRHILVTYRYDPMTGTMLGVVALASSSPGSKALAKMNTPGPQQATEDMSGFLPGPGSIVLTMSLKPPMGVTGGVPFHSA